MRALPLAFLLLAGCPDLPDPTIVEPDDEGPTFDEAPWVMDERVAWELPACAGGVLSALEADVVLPPASGSNGWMAPEDDTRASIVSSWNALMDGDAPLAVGLVAVVGYELCRGDDTESNLLLWRPRTGNTGRALIVWRWEDAAPLLVEAPHAFAGPDDLDAAITTFEATGARGLLVSGTHPCANAGTPACGTSELCGGPSASDPVTNPRSVLHVAHEVFASTWPDDRVVSLVASEEGGVSISDGAIDGADSGALVASLGGSFQAMFPDESITSCGAAGDLTVEQRSCASASVQARATNGAEDACVDLPSSIDGRFVQVAASSEVRAQTLPFALAVSGGVEAN